MKQQTNTTIDKPFLVKQYKSENGRRQSIESASWFLPTNLLSTTSEKCHQCISYHRLASSQHFIACTNVTHSVFSRDYVVPPQGPLKYPGGKASDLGGLRAVLPLTQRYDEREQCKISNLQRRGKMCLALNQGGATLVLSMQNAMSFCMLNTGLLAFKCSTPYQ